MRLRLRSFRVPLSLTLLGNAKIRLWRSADPASRDWRQAKLAMRCVLR